MLFPGVWNAKTTRKKSLYENPFARSDLTFDSFFTVDLIAIKFCILVPHLGEFCYYFFLYMSDEEYFTFIIHHLYGL